MQAQGKKGVENWHVLWQWCLASVGAVLAIVLGILVGRRFPSPLSAWPLGWYIEPYLARFALGAVVGLAQWVVLRTRLRRAGWWILATALAWAPAWARLEDGLRLSSAAEYAVIVVALSGVAGGVAGLGPWLVLRRHRGGAGWLLALPVAAGVAAGLALTLAPLLRREVLGVLGRVVARSDGMGLLGIGAALGAVWGAGSALAARLLAPLRVVAAFASALMGAVVGWFAAWGLWTASVVAFDSGIQGLVVGTLTGLAQWLVLWRKVPRSGWWVPASAAGWMLAMAWQEAVFDHVGNLSGSLAESGAVQISIIVLAPALISGVALVLLLGQGSRTAAAAAPASSRPAG